MHHGVPAVERLRRRPRARRAEQHPDADRLRVCTVDVGGGEPAQIVCGAPNVARRPDGRGRAAGRGDAGRHEAAQGEAARRRVARDDPQRAGAGDRRRASAGSWCSTLDGARAGHAARRRAADRDRRARAGDHAEPARLPRRLRRRARGARRDRRAARRPRRGTQDLGTSEARSPASRSSSRRTCCPRFTARVFEDVTVGPSPRVAEGAPDGGRPAADLQRRRHHQLRDAADRASRCTPSTSTASPAARLVVRDGRDGDELKTLDGETRTLDADMVVICDDDGPTSLAGVMGGARSRGRTRARRACCWSRPRWDGPNIQRTSTRLGLRSEASGRFEKGLAPEQAIDALVVATELIVELCGATRRARDARRRRAGRPRRLARRDPAARRARQGLLGAPIAARAQRRDPARSGLRRRRRRGRARRDRSRVPAQRRHARG